MRQIRTAAGLRVEDVAVAIDRSAASVALYEAGRVAPPVAVLVRIADVLDVTPAALFTRATPGAA